MTTHDIFEGEEMQRAVEVMERQDKRIVDLVVALSNLIEKTEHMGWHLTPYVIAEAKSVIADEPDAKVKIQKLAEQLPEVKRLRRLEGFAYKLEHILAPLFVRNDTAMKIGDSFASLSEPALVEVVRREKEDQQKVG